MSQRLIAIQREAGLTAGLAHFVRMAWPIVEPGSPMSDNWHIDVIAEHLEATYKREIRNLVIEIPPGCMKSLLTCVFWPVWVWIQDPSQRFLCASFDGQLTLRDARKAKDLITSEWFQARWGGRVSVPADAPNGDYSNTQGGWRFATSVGGKTTGRHPDIRIIDDPIKPLDVSKVSLEKVTQWHKGTMSSRQRDPKTVCEVIIMQRLHQDDLAGQCEREGYDTLRLPMRYEASAPCYTKIGGDPRVDDGDLLWKDRFPEGAVKALEGKMGSRVAAAQLQQRPSPDGGAIFRREWFRHVAKACWPARFDYLCQSWDLTFKDGDGSDYVVGQVWGKAKGQLFLLDQFRGKVGFAGACAEIRAMRRKWPKALAILVEDKANGPAVIETLSSEVPGIVPVNPNGGKVARANAVQPAYEAGNILLPDPSECTWIDAWLEEHVTFPVGSHDDQVDAGTQAVTYLLERSSNFSSAMEKIRQGLFDNM